MKSPLSLVAVGALLAMTAGCDNKATEGGGGGGKSAAPKFEFVVWPESGSTIYDSTPIYVGDPTKAGTVTGTIAVVAGGDAPSKGSAMPASAMKFAAGSTHGQVKLPAGKQKLHVHLFDAAGKATGMGQTVDYTVEATPADLGVQWLEPADGAKVKSPFKVKFGVKGMEMSPSGQNALDKTMGHHHIVVNDGSVTPGVILTMGVPKYMHYGKAQTEAEVKLEPGTYELTMQFADAAHRSYGKALAKTIKITVEK